MHAEELTCKDVKTLEKYFYLIEFTVHNARPNLPAVARIGSVGGGGLRREKIQHTRHRWCRASEPTCGCFFHIEKVTNVSKAAKDRNEQHIY